MATYKTIDDSVEYILDSCTNESFDFLLNQLSWVDFSENDLSMLLFSKMFDRPNDETITPLKDVNNQLKILEMVMSDGLKLNNGGISFSYGHQLMRSSTPMLIKYALEHEFKFNQYTKNPKWHSLELLQMNYLSTHAEKDELLGIIMDQLKVGVDLSQTSPEDFFMKLNRNVKSVGWKELIDLYKNDSYMLKFFDNNFELMIKKEFFNLVPKDAIDIFIF